MHWVSASCGGEVCGMCLRLIGIRVQATHKVAEDRYPEAEHEVCHGYVQYVCCDHFKQIFGSWTHREETMGKAEPLTEFEKTSQIAESSKPRGVTGGVDSGRMAGGSPPIDVDHLFTYHPPTGDQPDRYNSVREGARIFAHIILANTKPSPEQTLAIRKLQEATMFANASIALEK